MDQEPERRDRMRRSAQLRAVMAVVACALGIAAVLAVSDWVGVDRLGRPWDRAARGVEFIADFLAAATV